MPQAAGRSQRDEADQANFHRLAATASGAKARIHERTIF
jgi:hypothetical protein